MTNTASQKQIDFINALKEQRDITTEEAVAAGMISRALWAQGRFDTKAASALIDVLKAQPYRARDEKPSETPSEVPEGMHRTDSGVIFKVQRAVHGSGRLYAKRLEADQKCYCSDLQGVPCGVCRDPKSVTWSFVHAPGAMKYLSAETAMTLEQAREFGAVYGTCVRCGRTLTDEESIAAGIGPICAGKWA